MVLPAFLLGSTQPSGLSLDLQLGGQIHFVKGPSQASRMCRGLQEYCFWSEQVVCGKQGSREQCIVDATVLLPTFGAASSHIFTLTSELCCIYTAALHYYNVLQMAVQVPNILHTTSYIKGTAIGRP